MVLGRMNLRPFYFACGYAGTEASSVGAVLPIRLKRDLIVTRKPQSDGNCGKSEVSALTDFARLSMLNSASS